MLTSIITFSVKNKLIVGLFVVALIIVGIYQVGKLPIDAVPDITNNQTQIITIAPSFGATDIERLITYPIEQANSNIAGMKEIRSFSRFGLSLVTIVFDDDVDIYWARQQVSERLLQVQNEIPPGIGTPTLGPISTGLGEIYQYVIKPKAGYESKYDATSLRTIQDWIVRRQLLGVPGVAEVSSFGGKLKQYEIAVNSDKLNAFSITLQDVFNALESNNQNTGGAYIEKGPTVLYIKTEGLLKSINDIENISIVRKDNPSPLFIRDVASVKEGFATRYGAMCYNDQGEVSGAIVMMLKGANSSEVIKNVKTRILQIQNTLPEGVEIEPFLDRTKMVNNAIGTVEKNLLEGALIVVFVLILFLGNFRAGLLVASVIPLAMLFAICMMNLFGVSGNLMSLGALDFGLIVDGAVIIVEAVMHQLHTHKKYNTIVQLENKQMDDIVTFSAGKMMNSAVFGQVIILIVYLPIFALQGIEGKMFKPMAQTVAFALLGAFLLSLTYIPMMSSFFLSKKVNFKETFSDKIMGRLESFYSTHLIKVLHYPKILISAIIILFSFSIFVLTTLGGEFIPALEEGDFAVDTRVLTGSNLKTTIEFTQKAAHILKTKFPEVLQVVTKIGSGEVPTDPMPMEASDMMVILKDKRDWSSAKSFDELSSKMSKALEDVPGITAGFQYPVQMRFNELMTGARQDVVCKIFGENLDTLSKYADKLGSICNKIDGVENLYIEPIDGMPQVVIDYNRQMIAQYRLSIDDINKAVNTAFAGQVAGLLFDDEKRFNIVVRIDAESKKNIEDIKNLLISTPSGVQIPLNQLAAVAEKLGPNQIQREDAKRRIVVGFNVKGRDVQSIVKELQSKIQGQLNVPTGYFVTYGGAFENLEKAKQRLMIAVPISLILIFILLFFAFNNVKQSLLIYTAIPLSAIGGILFLALRGLPFSISAGVGFIALFGVAVLNGIVLIAEFNRLKAQGITSLVRIVKTGARTRLRPVLMTAFVASLGFLPMAVSNGAGAEVQRPLATVVIGGLLIATFLTLFLLPMLYVLFEKGFRKNRHSMKRFGSLVILIFIIQVAQGQSAIKLNAAIDTAIANNLLLKNDRLKESYAKLLVGSNANIPKTMITSEWGQVNSALFDTKFGVSQTFELPIYYRTQKLLEHSFINEANLQTNLNEFELKKEVTKAYFQFLYLKKKEKLLQEAESMFKSFFQKATLRFKAGETNILEKTTAENQQLTITNYLKQIEEEIELVGIRFQYYLNAKETFVPDVNENWPTNDEALISNKVENHPLILLKKSSFSIIKHENDLDQLKRKPDFTVGINNNSFRGIGPDEVNYKGTARFTSMMIGVGIPIFQKAIKTKLNANKTALIIAENEVGVIEQTLKFHQTSAMKSLLSNTEVLRNFEIKGLKNAEIIKSTANKQFSSGELNYLDWVMLMNQAISVELGYLDALKSVNESIIEVQYLSNKTN